MKPPRVLLGVPTGWHLSALWQAAFMARIGEPRTFDMSLHWEPSNTKACSYSRLVDLAREGDYDYLWLWETNSMLEVPIQRIFERVQQFHCVLTPGRFQDDSIGTDAIFAKDSTELPSEQVAEGKRELMPWEVRWGCTHFVSMDRTTLRKLTPRFMWALKDTKLDHDMPIYCYDGDQWPDHPDEYVRRPDMGNLVRRMSIEQSLFSNVRAQGIGVWADAQLYSVNLRLGGNYRSLRLEDLPPR